MRTMALLILLTLPGSAVCKDTPGEKSKSFFTSSGSFVYANDGYHWGGLLLDVCRNTPVWNKKNTAGIFKYGIAGGYQLRTFDQFPEHLSGASVKGLGHRIGAHLNGELLFHFPPKKNILFGLGVFAGWYEVILKGSLENSALGIDDDYSAKKGAMCSGFIFQPGYRINDRFSINITGILPVPFVEYEIPGLFTTGLGIQFKL